jgi:N-methylhydantoinase A/oxoprolinase/acetone carboxylase beta subunit
VPTEKPRIPELPLQGEQPAKGALKGRRQIFWDGSRKTAEIFEMDELQPGNVVAGPAVVEAPATTLLVPPGWRATLDGNLIFRVEEV